VVTLLDNFAVASVEAAPSLLPKQAPLVGTDRSCVLIDAIRPHRD
jgi:hypothetical protein